MAKIKELIGEVLTQLIEEPDQLKKMEIIDNAEILDTEHSEAVEEGNEFEEKYNDLLAKFTTRFTGELVDNETTTGELDDEVDNPVDEEENEEVDFNKMSFEEAGFKDVTKRGNK